MATIVPIVEGRSEVESIGILLRRVVRGAERYDIEVKSPLRVHRYKIVKAGELEKAVELAARQDASAMVVILLDADDDCPAKLGPELLARAERARPDRIISVVIAKREFEAWFIGSIESLEGVRGIQAVTAPPEPEEIRGAKEWLEKVMDDGSYLATTDQPALTQDFSLDLARRRCDSFDKFMRDIESMIRAVSAG